MKKLTRQQKQDVNSVLSKYGTKSENAIASSISGSVTFCFMDLFLSGGTVGLASLFFSTVGGGGTGFLMGKMIDGLPNVIENKSGQKYKASLPVIHALQKMENRLSESFSLAAKDPRCKPGFEAKCREVESDLEKLSPAFEIVSGGPNGCGTERYEFVLACEQPSTPAPVITKLSDVSSKNELPPPPALPLASKALLKIAKY